MRAQKQVRPKGQSESPAHFRHSEVDALLRITRVSLQSSNPQELTENFLDELLDIFSAGRAFLVTSTGDASVADVVIGKDKAGNTLTALDTERTEPGLSASLNFEGRILGKIHLFKNAENELFESSASLMLETVANHIAIALDTASKTQMEVERKEMFKSLEVTRAIQSLLLPTKDFYATERFAIAGNYQPAYESGGDWWSYEITAHGNLLILVADVTGHGVGPAMVTAAIWGIYKVARVSLGSDTDSIPLIMEWMNAFIFEIGKGQYSATMSILEVDPQKKRLNWWTAAAPPIFKLAGDRQAEALVAKGAPLGSGQFLIGHVERDLTKDDMIMIFTDGVNELDLANGTQLGIKRLFKIFNETKDMSAVEARTHVLAKFAQIRSKSPQADDGTLIFVKVP